MPYRTKAQIMAIINMTPDSYFPTSRTNSDTLHIKIEQFIKEGADIFDIGGESTRPQATLIPLDQELSRVLPAIEYIRSITKKPISIDTMKPTVAELAIQKGATIVNDITGFQDRTMRKVLQNHPDVHAVLMHIAGDSKTMHSNIIGSNLAVTTVYDFFASQLELLEKEGIIRSRIILDPGIGFSKDLDGNLNLIRNASLFKKLECRLLYGISRKSWIHQLLNRPLAERLPATLAASQFLLNSGVDILRVHDVQAHKDLIETMHAL